MKKISTLLIFIFICKTGMTQFAEINNPSKSGCVQCNKEFSTASKSNFLSDAGISNFTESEIASEPDSIIGQNFNAGSNQWINTYKVEPVYDQSGNLILSTSYQWNQLTQHWIPVSKDDQSYNLNGRMELYKSYSWDASLASWINSLMIETKWDPDVYVSQSYVFTWNNATAKWDSSSKNNSTYDISGNITSGLRLKKDQNTSKWVNDWKEEYTYDLSGNNTKHCQFYWDVNLSQWDSAYKIERTYSIGKVIQINYQMDGNGIVSYACKYENTFENDEIIQQIATCNYHLSSDQYIYNKTVIGYDNLGNKKSIEYRLDKTNDLWIPTGYYIYQDLDYMTLTTSFNIYGVDTVPSGRTSYYYSELVPTDIIQGIHTKGPCLYPNPAQGYFYMETNCPECQSTLKVFDLQGRLCMNQILKNQSPVSTEKLNKGVYIYHITENDTIYTGKLVIQ